jgi:hypothetical protein
MKNRTLLINLPLMGGVSLLVLGAHAGLLLQLGHMRAREVMLLTLCALAQSGVLLSAAALIAGSFKGKWNAAIAWTLMMAVASLLAWDNLSYRWVGLHLDQTIPLLYWSTVTTFRVIQKKRMAVFLGLGQLFALVSLTLWVLTRWHGTRIARTVRYQPVIAAGALCLVVLALAETSFPKVLTNITRERRIRVLPLLPILLPDRPSLFFSKTTEMREMPPASGTETLLADIARKEAKELPDVYLFIIESLRADELTPEHAPKLSAFRAQTFGIEKITAASNCTHVSWYSLLHSRLPLFWSTIAHQRDYPFQSVPLAAFRRLGYDIRVIATPNMNYYAIGNTLFGPSRSLATEISDQKAHLKEGLTTIDELDRSTMNRTLETLDGNRPPALHLVFLDSTHHDYVWNKSFAPPFPTYLEKTPLLKVRLDPNEISLLKNRYLNAVAYIDSLLGEFIEKRKSSKRKSLVAITSDHGEEFFEEGHLSHASDLNRHQLEVPLLLSVPGRKLASQGLPVSHLDVLPTLLDAVGGYDSVSSVLDGRSLLRATPESSAIAAQCSNYTPYRYLIDAGQDKAVLEFGTIAKLGHKVIGTDLKITHHLDGDYKDVGPGRELPSPLLRAMGRLVPVWAKKLEDREPAVSVAHGP